MQDIELKKFGRFLSKLAEKSEHVYWLSSSDLSKIEYISPAYEKIWGRKIAELYENPHIWLSFLHPDDSRHRHPIMKMKERIEQMGAEARYEENYRIIRPDGEIRWIMDRGFPVYDDHGNCLAVTGVALDVTKERLAEIALENAKNSAEAANRAKTQFLANISHDAKTPLTGIIGMADIARRDINSRDIDRNRAEAIYACGMEMVSFFDSCLALSKMEMETWMTKNEIFSFKTLIKDIHDLFFPMAETKNLAFEIRLDDQLPETIEGQKESIYRILLNLIGNAFKFTHTGQIILQAFLISANKDEANIGLSVSDTGIGIPNEKFDVIFEKMHRLKSSYQSKVEGSGMGLYIVDQYLKKMGGSIEVKSRLGEGSEFIVSLPLKKISQTIKTEEKQPPSTLDHLQDKKPHILLVEDVPLIQHVTQALLTDAGFSVDIAGSGNEALEKFSRQQYDLIYMDIGLPDVSGYQVTKNIREKEKNTSQATPIIALTGHGTVDVKTFCSEAGMQAALSKPISQTQAKKIWQRYGEHQNINVEGLILV